MERSKKLRRVDSAYSFERDYLKTMVQIEESKGKRAMATHSGLRLRKLPRRVHISSVRRLSLFFSLWACLSSVPGPAEALKVSMPAWKGAILGTNVTLQCNISDYPPPELNIKKTRFIWYLETSEGNKREKLYSVVAGEHSSNRDGSRLDPTQLKNGNASLFLPQIQLNEEGTYICIVIDSSVRAEGATILDLVVEPTVQVSPKELEIEEGSVKTLTCRVNKFYPDSIVILWQKYSKHTSDKRILAEDIYTGTPVRNGDGTYNTTSKLRLQPSSQDQGNVYSCIVKHKSFARYPVSNVTLTVTEPKSKTGLIIGLVLGFLLISFLLVGSLLYVVFLKKHPPSVEMVGSEELKNLEETQLQCLISHFRPKPLQIDLFLVTEQNPKQKIASWSSVEEPMEDDENVPFHENLEEIFEVYPELKSKPKNYYDFQWKICIKPDIEKLKKFDLLLEVKHKGFQHGLCTKKKSFKVIGVPKLSNIVIEPSDADYGESVKLTCDVTDFSCEEIGTQWFLGDNSIWNGVTEKLDMDCNDCYKLTSRVEFRATALFCEKAIRFEVRHAGLTKPITREVYLKLPGKRPVLSEIKVTPDHQNILLEISISQFAPQDIQVRWYHGWKQISGNVNPKNIEIGEDHLCYFVSKVHLDPKTLGSVKTIKCEVKHSTSTEEKSLTLNGTESCQSSLEKEEPTNSNKKEKQKSVG